LLAAAFPATAEPKNVLHRLMEEPVTLFDWGIAQLDRDIAHTAGRTIPKYVGTPVTGSFYDWRANRITLFVSVPVPKESRTRQACALTFRDLVSDLTRNTPKGPSAAGWYLLNAFKPKAHFWADRFEDVGAKLLDTVHLEVTFIPATSEAFDGVQQRVRCRGRLDAEIAELTVEVTS
jgi:hypothetical protein